MKYIVSDDLIIDLSNFCVFTNDLFVWQARIDHDAKSRYCVYESDIATGMGVGALLFLLLSQLLVMFATHCMCFGRALTTYKICEYT